MKTVDNLIVNYLRSLTVTQGSQAGKPFNVLPWQKEFIRGAFADGVAEAALSMARGGGKSTLMAGIGLAHIDADGVMQPAAETTIIAGTEKQGRIIYDHAVRFAELLPGNHLKVSRNVTDMRIVNLRTKAELKVMAANARALHGSAPHLILADEIAQWLHTQADAILAALRTGLGKIPGSRLVGIGTRGAQAGDLWDSMLRTADYSQIYSAPLDASPYQRRTWSKACPSLRDSTRGLFPDLELQYKKEAEKAKSDPRVMQSFRALRLNQGVSDTLQTFVLQPTDFQRMHVAAKDHVITRPYILGVDLGSTAAMSAIAAYSLESKCLDVVAMFPNLPNLDERARQDGAGQLYRRMEARNELSTTGGHVVPVESLIELAVERWGMPAKIVCDRWRLGELKDALSKINFPLLEISQRGMGFKDGAEDVRLFRTAAMSGQVKVKESLLLTAAISEARVIADPAGNEKLAKGVQGGRRKRGKDDALAAAIIAVAEGVRMGNRPVRSRLTLGIAR